MAREEEERVKKDEVLRAASLSRHIIRRLTSLDAGQDDLKQQHEELNNVRETNGTVHKLYTFVLLG